MYRHLIGARIRAQLQYRTSFALLVLGSFALTAVDLVELLVLFRHFDALAGWSLPEIALLYGISGVGIAIGDMLIGHVEQLHIDIRSGQFDVVLFLGVFYHLVDPIQALQNVAALTKEVAVVESHLDLATVERPAMVFYPGAELNNDPTNWWGPNRACMQALLRLVGFTRIEYQPHPIVGSARGIFHAYKQP